jgi:Transposase zinc-binding domain
MGAIQDIFRRYAPEYLKRFAAGVCAEQRKVIAAIGECRTVALGSVCYRCEDCGHPHIVPAACGNRHCPQCQHRKAHLWLARQLERQLPGPHFMLTFTVPEALRAFLLVPSAPRLRGAVRGLLSVDQDAGARLTLRRR